MEPVGAISGGAARADRRFHLLDLLRAGAALAVVLYHLVEAGHTPFLRSAVAVYAAIAENGYLGVPVFFVLSGFVISHSLYGHRVDPAYVGRFILKRSVRLDPPYWAAICVVIAASYASALTVSGKSLPTYTWPQIAAHVVYLQDILRFPEISGVFWTLCMEFQFYLVYAVLICLATALLASRSQIGPCIAAAALGSLIWPIGFGPAIPAGVFLPLWYGFLSGALCYWSWRHPRLAPVLVVFLVVLAAASWFRGDRFALTCAVTSAAIYVAAVAGQLARPIPRPVMFLATISFSLYLIHNPVTGVSFRVAYGLLGRSPLAEVAAVVLVLLLNVGAAAVFWWLIERPCAKLSSRLGRDRPRPAPRELRGGEIQAGIPC